MNTSHSLYLFVGLLSILGVAFGHTLDEETCRTCNCSSYHDGFSVNCFNRFIHSVPKDIPQNVTKLNLSTNSLSELSEEVFMMLKQLVVLDLSANQIIKISERCFAYNVKLEELKLSKNQLHKLPSGLFSSNQVLKEIKLSDNHLYELPSDLFSSNYALRKILLYRNKLGYIPEKIFANNSNLTHVDISDNDLHELPPGLLLNNHRLQTIKMCSNELRELPKMFFKSSESLRDINFCQNHLSAINKSSFHGLNLVYTLILYQNKLSTLPSDLFSEVSLDGIVFFSSNGLREIPRKLFCSNIRPHQLMWLFLHKNELTHLQDNTFNGLPNLTHLFLHDNNISCLGDDVFVGTGLQYIFLFSNKLDELTNQSFSGISASVREVHLYKNNIARIFDEVLPTTVKKLTIFVDCGKLNELPKLLGNISISCVKDTMLPEIQISGRYKHSIKATLINDAFQCNSTTKNPNCSPCPTGTFGDGDNGCSPCPAGGYYQDEIGCTQCKQCKNGTFTRKTNSRSSDSCEVCPDGTNFRLFAGHRACYCKMDFARIDRFEGCSLCYKPGVNCSQDYQSLRFGYYWNWSFPGANLTSYSNFVSRIQNDSLEYNDSNSRYRGKIPKVHHCPRRESCQNQDSYKPDAIEGRCEEGYRGWLCSKCESRYYSILHVCIKCPSPVWIVLETVLILLLAFGLYVLVKRQDYLVKKQRKQEHRTLVDKISSQMKIVLGFYQVIGELFESFGDLELVGPLKFMGQVISFLKVNILRFIVRPHCLNEKFRVGVKLQMIISLTFPFGMVFCFTALYLMWKLVLKYRLRYHVTSQELTLANLKNRLLTYALLLLFITYPPTCDVIFKFYPGACKTFHVFENDNITNITLLRADYDIVCTKLKTYHLLAYVATVSYVLAFPCALFWLLQKYCKRNSVAKHEALQDGELARREGACLLQGERETFGNIPVWLKFLCENYKPKFWYWEIVELARKVTQTILVTLLGWEDVLTKLITISISVLFLTLHAKLAPMTSYFEQRLQMFSLAAIFINVLVESVAIPDSYEKPISTVLIILNMIIIFIILGEVIVITFRFMKKKYLVRAR